MLKKKRTRILLVLLLTILLLGYGKKVNSLEYKISKYIDENYEGESLTIRLSDFTSFEWDRAVIFNVGDSAGDVEEILDLKYYYSNLDVAWGIAFAKGNRVVYDEIFRTHKEHLIGFNDNYRFSLSARRKNDDDDWHVVFHNDAEFVVRKRAYDSGKVGYVGYLKH